MIRRQALEMIRRWEKDGTFLSRLLRQKNSEEMEPRDRALLTELVYGPIRWRATLDQILMAYSKRGLKGVKPRLMEILRQAVYQIIFLDRIPNSAAVNEAVNLATKIYPKKVSGFSNGLLRSLARGIKLVEETGPDEGSSQRPRNVLALPHGSWLFDRDVFPDSESEPAKALAARFSHPEWLVNRWCTAHGVDQTKELLAANNRTPSVTLRFNRLKTTRETIQGKLTEAGIKFKPGTQPQAIILDHAGKIEDLPGFADGWFLVQDEASQAIAPLLAPQPGENILDLCAAPGGKTTHIAELTKDEGTLIALDTSEGRARKIRENADRLGLSSIRIRISNACQSTTSDEGKFDRVLVDAPCSNTGTFARRPEARWRIEPGHLGDLHQIQVEILDAALNAVKPGGRVVYSTCSIEPEENQQVIATITHQRKDVTVEHQDLWLPSSIKDGGFAAALTRNGS